MVEAKKSSPQMYQRYRPTAAKPTAAGIALASVAVEDDERPSTGTEGVGITRSRSVGSDGGIATMNRELAVAERLGGGRLPGGHGEDLVEQARRRGLERLRIVHDAADVEVDVVGHLARGARVAG